jgi:hypothetical protein
MQIVDGRCPELPWLEGRDKELVMGDAICNWPVWNRPA